MLFASIMAIGIHIGTAHVDPDMPLNDFNPGVYAVFDNGVTVGTYYNSIRKQTVYAGYTAKYKQFSLMVGGATGYNYKVVPMIVPSVVLPLAEDFNLRIAYIPKMKITGAHVVHFTVEKTF